MSTTYLLATHLYIFFGLTYLKQPCWIFGADAKCPLTYCNTPSATIQLSLSLTQAIITPPDSVAETILVDVSYVNYDRLGLVYVIGTSLRLSGFCPGLLKWAGTFWYILPSSGFSIVQNEDNTSRCSSAIRLFHCRRFIWLAAFLNMTGKRDSILERDSFHSSMTDFIDQRLLL